MSRLSWVVAALVFCVALAAAVDNEDIATKYKCGTECDEKLMGSSDDSSDAMPHTFGSEVPLDAPALPNAMNAYLPSNLPEDIKMAPLGNGVYGMPGNSEGVAGLHALPSDAQIPYEPSRDVPALRRPCNLEEVADLLRSIKKEYQDEDTHDSRLHATAAAGSAAFLDSQTAVEESNKRVEELLEAKQANETLTNVITAIALKADLLQSSLVEKGVLISQEGSLKDPIIRSLGRTKINLQSAVTAKQAALNEIAAHPAFTKEEIQQITTTYDELIISIKKQLEFLHGEAASVLTPVQLKINQTEHAVERLEAEIAELRKEQAQLLPVAENYSPIGLETARAIASAALAHFAAEKEVQTLELGGYDQRSKDRSEIAHLVDQMLTNVLDIQQPQDPAHVFAESKQPRSLAGSVPKRPVV